MEGGQRFPWTFFSLTFCLFIFYIILQDLFSPSSGVQLRNVFPPNRVKKKTKHNPELTLSGRGHSSLGCLDRIALINRLLQLLTFNVPTGVSAAASKVKSIQVSTRGLPVAPSAFESENDFWGNDRCKAKKLLRESKSQLLGCPRWLTPS